jgi:hypothetical protein
MNNDNGDLFNAMFFLCMHSKSFHFILVHNSNVNYYVIIWFHSFVVSFVCNCLWFLFIDYAMTVAALKGRKCPPLRFLFRDDADLLHIWPWTIPKVIRRGGINFLLMVRIVLQWTFHLLIFKGCLLYLVIRWPPWLKVQIVF